MRNKLIIVLISVMLSGLGTSFAALPPKKMAASTSTAANAAAPAQEVVHHKMGFLPRVAATIGHFFHAEDESASLFNEGGRRDNTQATLSLIFGITSIVTFWTIIGGIAFGIPAIILGAHGVKRRQPTSVAGLVTGIVGTTLSIMYLAILIVIVSSFL